MSTSKPQIFLVIPAWNEARNIEAVLRSALPSYPNIVVVDDGSTDATARLATALGAIVLRHVTNRGQGAALRTGTKYAFANGADIVVHFDADGQFLVDDIETLVAEIRSGRADIVFGSRFLSNTTKMPWFKEQVIMPLARLFNRIFFKINLTDPQGGFRAFNLKAFQVIIWQQDAMAHATEILHRAAAGGLGLNEVPITVIYHHFGQRLSGGFKIIKDFIIHSLIE